jgi:D-threonate/D-erythronate kinase
VSSDVRTVGLVADDLTGASDSAVQFAQAGWAARLERAAWRPRTEPIAGEGPAVIALTTGARATSADEAADRTAAAVRHLLGRGVDRLFLKIDSTVRGSVPGQIRGALSAWNAGTLPAVAVICPAFPQLGRTVVGGTVLVDGVPLARTAAADDPVTPVTESRLDVLLPGAVLADPLDVLAGRPDLDNDQFVCDAATDDDLARIAEVLDRLGRRAVAVGSAGLAQAVAAGWGGGIRRAPDPPPARRVLVAVSSLHPEALLQLAGLRAFLAGHDDPGVRVISSPAERAGTGRASEIATQLAVEVADQVRTGAYDALVIVGGDGAAAVLDQLQVEAVQIRSALVPGAPDGRAVGGMADGLRLVTKSGGFGGPDTLITLVQRLRAAALPSEVSGAEPVPARPNPKEDS